MKFDIISVDEHEDGSATLTIDLGYDELVAFAKIGIHDTLVKAAREEALNELTTISQEMGLYDLPPMNTNDDVECRSNNPAKVCYGCSCWKNQSE